MTNPNVKAHAANAYPQLVAALRVCQDNLAGMVPHRGSNDAHRRDTALEHASAVLRSLGEIE